jgi:hypothetical protein
MRSSGKSSPRSSRGCSPFGLTVSAGIPFPAAAVALVPLVLAPIVSYRYAVGQFERYTLA